MRLLFSVLFTFPMPSDTPSPEPHVKPRIRGGWLVLVVPLLLVGYVLSSGPTMRLVFSGAIRAETYELVYAPLLWCSKCRPFWRAWSWYFGQWIPADFVNDYEGTLPNN